MASLPRELEAVFGSSYFFASAALLCTPRSHLIHWPKRELFYTKFLLKNMWILVVNMEQTPQIISRRHSVCVVSLLKSNISKFTHDKKTMCFCGVTKTPLLDILTNWSIPTAPLKSRCNFALLRCLSYCSSFTWTCHHAVAWCLPPGIIYSLPLRHSCPDSRKLKHRHDSPCHLSFTEYLHFLDTHFLLSNWTACILAAPPPPV